MRVCMNEFDVREVNEGGFIIDKFVRQFETLKLSEFLLSSKLLKMYCTILAAWQFNLLLCSRATKCQCEIIY